MNDAFFRALEAIAPVKRDEPLSRHTTIGIGGPADAFVSPRSAEELSRVLALCHEASVPVFMLGSGSNIVIGDRGIRGVTVDNRANRLSEAKRLAVAEPRGEEERFLFRAESGCSFAGVSRQLSFAGYKGMEWACGIPGTLGGAVVYNAGAYGGCLGDVLERVCVWQPDSNSPSLKSGRGQGGGVDRVFEAQELGLVYRGSAFTRGLMAGRAVLWAEFALWPGDSSELRGRIAEYDERRLKAQPRGRNAGSFFKNPPDHPSWKLLDGVGMRGYRIGGAEFSAKHCNFLVNAGDAKAADVAALKREAETRVFERFGIRLENEVTLVGEWEERGAEEQGTGNKEQEG